MEKAASQFRAGVAQDEEQGSGALGVCRHATVGIGHNANAGDKERTRNGLAGVLVVEAVLAGDEGSLQRDRRVPAPLRGPHQRPQPIGKRWIAPAEVVKQGDVVGIGTGTDQVANSLVNSGTAHGVRIVQAEHWVDPLGHRDGPSGPRRLQRLEDHTIGRPVLAGAGQGPHQCAAPHFVVERANHLLLAGDRRMHQESLQGFIAIGPRSSGWVAR